MRQTALTRELNKKLRSLASRAVVMHNLPGLAIAFVDDTGVKSMGVAGVRKIGEVDNITLRDQFHLGSCTKAITATLLARLSENGVLSFERRIVDYFPCAKINEHFRDVTIADLLWHRSGLGGGSLDAEQIPLMNSATDNRVGRAELAARLLSSEPRHPRGTFRYSNCGWAIVGAICEAVMSQSFEDIMREQVFNPLELATAGFGPPSVHGSIKQPYGHRSTSLPVEPGLDADLPSVMASAGTIHMSLIDWGRFASIHLGGIKREFLREETINLLHKPPQFATGIGKDQLYAMGWLVTNGHRQQVLIHTGSNGMWYCQIVLFKIERWGVLVACNQGNDIAEKAVTEVSQTAIAIVKGLLNNDT